MKPEIGIPAKKLAKVIDLLSVALADEHVIYLKTRKFHWNVSGESFMELHKLFENQYKQVEAIIDEVAERIGKLGGETIGTMQEFLKNATLKEHPGKIPGAKSMISELMKDHEAFIRELRKNVKVCDEECEDAGTADFLTGIMETHETIAWTLRRYVG
jgi:starvation-inducible DNA-binding protein